MSYQLLQGDCLSILPTLPSASVDAVITDPPYPEIERDYGRLSEGEWWELMMGVCSEVRRILKPAGSAVFILQPNSRTFGSMRGWLWEFMAWVCRDWNMVQDAYWWNITAVPTAHCTQHQLMRPSMKACVWAGANDCYREQANVLWSETESNVAYRSSRRLLRYSPSGQSTDHRRMSDSALARGGVTPYNVLPIANSDSSGSSGANGHGAGTPQKLADWWTRYIVPSSGVVLDPFNGAGTMGIAALRNGASYIGIEQNQAYVDTSHERLARSQPGFAFDLPPE